ncbi:RING finger protein 112-like [Malaclemys terrapin pileata]|uniref:RING finger protein 112-like n=1 Tax=Malaclemys terrapin pileata TaxID=2991368 RepID=UPI0023A8AE3B|nr:RING finger protein 112-like [Malaclemys terrapin pileata]
MEQGRPVQLVRLDEEGGLTLDEEALSRCLEQGGVGDAPVCLVSIIGEQRRGKSFLLNYLLRRLQSPDMRDGSWMGQEEEPLEGFEWRVGTQNVTKGVWAWSQPFWVPGKGGKVAVLLVDTEGSMNIESNKETSIKLSAMSMLLSSYQILNIGCRVKDPDLEYLEMFLQVAEVVGEAYGLEPIQHLDLLVRDWSSSLVLGARGGKKHLRDVRQILEETSPSKHPKALEALSRSSSRCYLMPSPGKRIMTGSEGTLRDMDEDFRESLRDYVTALVGSAGRHVRRNQHGELLTGTQLASWIKKFSDLMKTHHFGFSSPCQMAITFHNQRVLDSARQYHAFYLKDKDGLSQRMVDCLKVDPSAMEQQLVEQRRSLLGRCREEMKEPEETLLTALEAELTREAETFLETYGGRYQCHATNKRVMDRARRDHADFLRQKDGLSQRMIDCLMVTPGAMEEQLVEQRRLLLRRCRKEMKEPEKKTLMTALKVKLTRVAKTFLKTYRRRYRCHAIKAGIAVGGLVLGSLSSQLGVVGYRAVATVAAKLTLP